MPLLGGVGRRALQGTLKSDTSIAQSDQPSAGDAMPKPKPLVDKIVGQQLATRIKKIKVKQGDAKVKVTMK